MLQWFSENLATIIVCAVLALVTVLIVVKLVRDRKSGKASCGGNCAGCPNCGGCHHWEAGVMTKYTLKIDGMMCGMCESHINDTIRKAAAVKKKADDAGQDPPLLSQAEAGTLFYKDWRFQDLLELPYSKPNALVKFILEHYLVLDPDSIGLNRIRIASGESTAADLAADYLAELDNATSGYSLDAGDPDEKEAYAARLSDLNCLQYSFQWNLHDQLCAAADRLLYYTLGDIERDYDALDLLLRITDEVADVVPVHRALSRRPGKQALLDLTYRCHVPTPLFFLRSLR